jgi:hypothetical protein
VGKLRSAAFIDAISAAWRDFGELIETDMAFDAEVVQSEGLRFLTRHLAAGLSMTLEADPAYPQLVRFADPTLSWGINNPDGNYAFAALDGDGTYRLAGDIGTATHIDLQLHAPSFTEAPNYQIVGALKRDDLEIGADGRVEIILSPNEHPGNWLRTTPDTGSLILRQFFCDWASERPANLAIERLDAAYPPPPLGAEFVQSRLEQLQRWMTVAGEYWHVMCKFGFEVDNQLIFQPPAFSDDRGHQGQSYGFGNFRIGAGEAVVIEIDPPGCAYWAIQLGNRFWESLDWDRRQTSLNHTQLALDGDGLFRGVISIEDPGVANWLDPAGNAWGSIMGRFIQPQSTPKATLAVVPFAQLDDVLPADTRRVSRDERDSQLRARSIAAQLRQGF